MLLEFFKYATRLLRNNMTTIILATTTATATTPTLNITTNFTTATTTNISNIISSALPTQNGMLPEQPATTQPPLEFFNSTLKTFFNKTLANVAQTNLSDYTTPSPLFNGTGVAGGMAGGTLTGGAATVMSALPTLPVSRYAMEATTSLPAQTVATFMAAGNKNRATIIVYPTVSPESIVIPIVSCIFGFPILALLVICCLRRRAKLARERDRRRNYDMQDHAVSLVRFSPIHRLSTSDMSKFICSAGCQRQTCQTSPTITSTTSASNCRLLADDSRLLPALTVSLITCGVDNYRPSRAISLRPERSLSQGFTSLELDTVVEERCSDVEQTQTEILNAESPMETTSSYRMSFSS